MGFGFLSRTRVKGQNYGLLDAARGPQAKQVRVPTRSGQRPNLRRCVRTTNPLKRALVFFLFPVAAKEPLMQPLPDVPGPSAHFRFQANDERDTRRLGAALADVLPPGTTVGLIGTLGAGKTRLVQAIAAACGIPPDRVLSPTFVLCQPYQGNRTLYHLDAYRLSDDDEFLELGPEEYFESEGLTLIEWSDRVAACLPPERVEIRIEVVGEQARDFELTAWGSDYQGLSQQLAAAVREQGGGVE